MGSNPTLSARSGVMDGRSARCRPAALPQMAMAYSIGLPPVFISRPSAADHCLPKSWGMYQTVLMTMFAIRQR